MSEPNQQPDPQAGNAAPASPADTPPWGDAASFDPEKAWNLIQGLRADKERLSARETLTDDQRDQLGEYQRLVENGKSDLDKANESLTRWQSEAETWRKAAVGSRVEAIASTDFVDPSDAVAAVGDPTKFLGTGGQIDEQAIRRELGEVLEKKPHWRKAAGPAAPRTPAPNPAQGAGGSPVADPAAEFASLIQGRLGGSR